MEKEEEFGSSHLTATTGISLVSSLYFLFSFRTGACHIRIIDSLLRLFHGRAWSGVSGGGPVAVHAPTAFPSSSGKLYVSSGDNEQPHPSALIGQQGVIPANDG